MSAARYVVIDGKRHLWRDILQMRREQQKARATPQATLFELKDDRRPESQRTASDRFQEPPLFR
jgi:hypothetical protein